MRPARAHPFPPKLEYADADRIRERYAQGESARALAREYSISVSCLYDVLRRRSYAGRLAIQVTESEMKKLEALAVRAGATREQVATAILRARLAQVALSQGDGQTTQATGGSPDAPYPSMDGDVPRGSRARR